jgi:hypothetical protein
LRAIVAVLKQDFEPEPLYVKPDGFVYVPSGQDWDHRVELCASGERLHELHA